MIWKVTSEIPIQYRGTKKEVALHGIIQDKH